MQVARAARIFLKLDRLIWVPTYDPPHKDAPATPFIHRLGMTRAAAAEPGEAVSDIEASLPQPSYTLHTLRALKKAEGGNHEWFLIIGSDSWKDFHNWNQPEAVRAEATLAVHPREDFPLYTAPNAIRLPGREVPGESRRFRARFRENPDQALAELPRAVAAYIRKHGLYGLPKAAA